MNNMDPVDVLMKQGIADGVFPGGVLLVAQSEKIRFMEAYGQANIYTGRRINIDTVFDLASLTKPLATTLAVLILIQENRLSLDQPVAEIMPEFINTDKAGIRLDQLLAHVSGLPDYRPYFNDLSRHPLSDRKFMLTKLILDEPLVHPPGGITIYSDIGFMLLALLVERTAGQRLDVVVKRKIYQPMGIRDLFFIDIAAALPERDFAATEDCAWRCRVVQGTVHDENAYALGGISGHAGLFGTAEAVYGLLFRLLKGVHGAYEVLDPSLLQHFMRRQAGCERALGFDVPSANDSSAGNFFNREATVGHLGFTGTSFWMALDRGILVVLLTNRIHPSRDNEAIKRFRPRLHDAIMTSI